MASYRLVIKRSAAKELADLPAKDRKRIVTKLTALAADRHPPGAERLTGEEKYRIRQGDYRVLYAVDDGEQVVTIVKIGHRRDVYR